MHVHATTAATLQKMIKEYLPGDVRIGGEAVEMLVNCCTGRAGVDSRPPCRVQQHHDIDLFVHAEFVQLLSSEANEVSTREKKSTITPDHVMKALQELGFSEFLEEVTAAWEEHKEESKSESLWRSLEPPCSTVAEVCTRGIV